MSEVKNCLSCKWEPEWPSGGIPTLCEWIGENEYPECLQEAGLWREGDDVFTSRWSREPMMDCPTYQPKKPANDMISEWNTRASGWLPIETAPKDGRRILTCNARIDDFHVVRWHTIFEEWSELGGGVGALTHWQPLPPSPEGK